MQRWTTCYGFVLTLWSQSCFCRPSRHLCDWYSSGDTASEDGSCCASSRLCTKSIEQVCNQSALASLTCISNNLYRNTRRVYKLPGPFMLREPLCFMYKVLWYLWRQRPWTLSVFALQPVILHFVYFRKCTWVSLIYWTGFRHLYLMRNCRNILRHERFMIQPSFCC
jgi:hypothetical protein